MKNTLLSLSLLAFLCLNLNAQDPDPDLDTLLIVNYNLLNFNNNANGLNQVINFEHILQYMEPDVLLAVEVMSEEACDMLLEDALNVNGKTNYLRSSFVANQSNTFNNLQHVLFYNSDKLVLKSQSELITDLRDINVFEMYYNDPLLAQENDTIFLEFYLTHLKAGTGTTNEARRESEVTVLKDYLDAKPSNANRVFAGDFNLYDADEAAYNTLLNEGTYPFFDPIDAFGNWHDNAAFASIHTQCTRLVSIGDGGSSAGLDDRFDFILASEPIMNNTLNVRYIPNSYIAFGNSGTHFNNSLLTGANTVVPESVRTALYYGSDHLPVIMELEVTIPPILLATKLQYFKAEIRKTYPSISWASLSESNVNHYTLERSTDAIHFEEINQIDATGNGSNYQYQDLSPHNGVNYYRLKTIDFDGEINYSVIQSVKFNVQRLSINLHANPAEDWLEFEILSPETQVVNIEILDMNSKLLYQKQLNLNQAASIQQINIKHLASGVYILKTNSSSQEASQINRFLKQ